MGFLITDKHIRFKDTTNSGALKETASYNDTTYKPEDYSVDNVLTGLKRGIRGSKSEWETALAKFEAL